MWPRFGIKVGNSTLCIAYSKEDGKVDVIANKQGDRVSQACVLFDGNEVECGLTAKQKMSTRPKQGVANSFQLLLPEDDLTDEKVESANSQIPCEYDPAENVFQLKCVEQGDVDKAATRALSPYEVQVLLFRAELELARQYHSDAEQKPIVVLSIPSYYPKDAWPMLAEAAEEAGFHVAQVVCEPTAAVVANCLGEDAPTADTKFVLTVKCGGLFSHFALYAVRNGMYSQLDAFGPFPIGGRHYTEALVQFICEEFQRKYKLDPHESRRSIAKIRTAAANCKHILTTLPSTQVYIDSLMDGVDFNTQMSRARFESLIQPVIGEFMQTLSESVERAMTKHSNITGIDHIVLLGATMAIPKLQSVIAARFPDACLHTSTPTDEVVAVGCARQATFLVEPAEQELELAGECTCTADELLIWHADNEGNAQVLLAKGTVLPTTVRLDVKQSKDAALENAETFRLRTGHTVSEVYLEGVVAAEDGVFQLEAKVDLTEREDDVVPVVRLRSL